MQEIKSDDADAISQLSEQDILSAMQRLPDVYRTVFNLYVLEGFSHKEIAEQLEINESTSRSNLAKARAKLRMILSSLCNDSFYIYYLFISNFNKILLPFLYPAHTISISQSISQHT